MKLGQWCEIIVDQSRFGLCQDIWKYGARSINSSVNKGFIIENDNIRVMEPISITGRLLLSAPLDHCSVVIHLILIYMNQNISKVGFVLNRLVQFNVIRRYVKTNSIHTTHRLNALAAPPGIRV